MERLPGVKIRKDEEEGTKKEEKMKKNRIILGLAYTDLDDNCYLQANFKDHREVATDC